MVSITHQPLSQLMSQGRNWIFTLNNHTEEDVERIKQGADWIRYIAFQHERGENGTNHLQGYIECLDRVRLSRLRDFIPRGHFEIRRGSQSQAIEYATKQDTRVGGPWHVGEPFESRQGRRTDLDTLANRLYEGATVEEIRTDFPGHSLRYMRQISEAQRERRRKEFGKTPRPGLEVYVFWGDPGTGKTRRVYESEGYERVFTLNTSSNGALWFDGYEGEPVLLIDDFRGWIKFNEFLKILDIYPLRIPIKGSFDYAAWTRVYITSNHDPTDWYREESGHCYPALRRRFFRVEHYSTDHPWSGEPVHMDEPIGGSGGEPVPTNGADQ